MARRTRLGDTLKREQRTGHAEVPPRRRDEDEEGPVFAEASKGSRCEGEGPRMARRTRMVEGGTLML
jgi:hypothetical protein